MIRGIREDLAAAFGLLTRIPVGHVARAPAPRDVWAYPVVGAVVGAAGGAVYAGASGVGVPSALCALLAITATALLTGALHEDGLADTADGFFGGATRERKLEIMRDSRIGTFGALALMLSTAIRATAVSTISRPLAVFGALVLAGTAGRAAIVMLSRMLMPARNDGMAAGIGRSPGGAIIFALAISLAMAFAMLPPMKAVSVCAAATLGCLAVAWRAKTLIGGFTGDVLGAVEIVVECAVLIVAASAA
jgi:adenosylcobinamide-GDP ribazoletransferase